MDKKQELLDAAEDVARCATGKVNGLPVIFVSWEEIIRLRKAVQAIRPYYHLEGGRKVYDQPANWNEVEAEDVRS